MNARPEIVELLSRVNLRVDRPENLTYMDNGELLTPEDADRVGSATVEELRAVSALLRERMTEDLIAAEIARQMQDLVLPYFTKHSSCRNVGELMPHMAPEDRSELQELHRALQAFEPVK